MNENKNMVEKRTWEEFRSIGLLWFANRILHLFGWAIVFEYDDNKEKLKEVYPARCKFRGFNEKNEGEGFIKVTNYLASEIDNLKKETLLK